MSQHFEQFLNRCAIVLGQLFFQCSIQLKTCSSFEKQRENLIEIHSLLISNKIKKDI